MAGSTPDGVLLSGTPTGESWAYLAFALSPAPLPGGLYPEFSEARRRADRVAAERSWLAALWTDRTTARWDLRFIGDPASGRVEAALIAQLYGRNPDSAIRAARETAAAMERFPAHVTGTRVMDTADIERLLTPFVPVPGGVVEIRKRIVCRTLTRAWGTERLGTAVLRYDAQEPSWDGIWSHLAGEPRRTVVSVCLEPCTAPPGLAQGLTMRAQAFGTLAVPGAPDPMYGTPVPGDPFAQWAADLYGGAARRYTGRLHRTRISIAAEGRAPVSGALAGLICHTVAPQSSGAVVVVPRDPGEFEVACGNLLGVNRDWLRESYWQEVPPYLRTSQADDGSGAAPRWLSDPDTVVALADLVDADEAAAVFRLPHQEPGEPDIFTLGQPRRPETPPPGPPASGQPAPGWDDFAV